MAASAPPVTTAEVAALHDRITRFVFANFHRKLAFEEARDAAAEALGEADRAVAAGQQIHDLDAWLCKAAWRNAISMVRRIEGEGRRKRDRPLDITEQGEWLRDESLPSDEIVERDAKRAGDQALVRAWKRLKPDEQRALHLRYFDELPVPEVLAILGCSRHHYENLTKRGLRKLRDALVTGEEDEACRACRTAIVSSKLAALDDADAARRDAHLGSCLTCSAFDRRQRGLIAALPLPAVGLLDRATARVHTIVAGGPDVAHSGEVAAGTVALAGAGAGAGAGAMGVGGAASGLLTVGGAAKALAVVCSAGAVTAGICVTAAPSKPPTSKTKTARAAKAQQETKSAAVAASAPALVPVSQQGKPSPSGAERAEIVASARRAHEAAARTPAEASRREASPFLPESAAPPPAAAPNAERETTTYSAAPAPARQAHPATPPAGGRGAFAEEFTP